MHVIHTLEMTKPHALLIIRICHLQYPCLKGVISETVP